MKKIHFSSSFEEKRGENPLVNLFSLCEINRKKKYSIDPKKIPIKELKNNRNQWKKRFPSIEN
jgi:hypothetical protein